MSGNSKSYNLLASILLAELIVLVGFVIASAISGVQIRIYEWFGENFGVLMLIAPWGAFGALMNSLFLAAKDKHARETHDVACGAPAPRPPDGFDLLLYVIYFASGWLVGILSSFLLLAGADYFQAADVTFASLRDKFPLFAIVAFGAGYSQQRFISRVNV